MRAGLRPRLFLPITVFVVLFLLPVSVTHCLWPGLAQSFLLEGTHLPLGPDQPAAGRPWGCSLLWSFLCTHQQFILIPRIALFCRTICELAGPAHISLLLFLENGGGKKTTNHIQSLQCKGFKYQHYVWIDRNTISNKSFGCLWTLALFFLLYF